MKLDFHNPAHLKIHLLSDGIRLGNSFFKCFDSCFQGSPYHYSKDNTFKQKYPHHMILGQKTVCALNLDDKSPWELEAKKNNFHIKYKNKIISKVNFPKNYPFLKDKLTKDVIAEDIGFMTTPNSMNVFVGKSCFFFEKGLPCQFCGFNPTRNILKDKDYVDPKIAQKLIKKFLQYDNEINQVYFVGSTDYDFDKGFKKIIEVVRAAKEVAPDHLDLIVTSFPPKNLKLIKELKKAGADRISFAIEAANSTVFKKICPGKEKYYGHKNFIKALQTATDSFHRATYASMIQGLDKKEDLINFMWYMIENGIMPTMNIFYHSPYSVLKNTRKRPSVKYLFDVSREHQKIFAKSNIRLFSYGADRHCLDWEAFRQMI